MILYPTIELQNGHCVSLSRGDLNEPQIWHVDPVKKACEFAAVGAEWMHVTDFDALAKTGSNADLIEEIILHAGLPVQVAGGIRTMDQVEHWVEKGAGRVVIGTAAVLNPQFIHQAAKAYPDQIVLAVDVRDGLVTTDGWKSQSAFTPEAFVKAFVNVPLAGILYTDVNSDVGDSEGSLAVVSALAEMSRTPLIVSGLVKTVDDISRLKYIRNIAGAIVGRALFNRSIDLAEALELARPEAEPVAEFI